ncbi:hypothetical protein PPYR_07233 [Photinus pyralis]|uniref:Cilia- and flagella-associated protein 126 n=1 Tax=Photinus pyralis TaxID=7054 RepID=A0A1Y1LPN7_PHOPY|nr:hypothetical protein PPYR_07233 [Photinus pyralis]
MAYHFSANQFEGPFKPTRLRNWEVPHWYPKRPCANHGRTVINSNDRGNLLPGVPRSKVNQWGNYIGTWHYPRKITRKIADEISAPRQDKILAWKRHCQKSQKNQSGESNRVSTEETVQVQDAPVVAQEEIKLTDELPKDEKHPVNPLCPIHDM